MLRPLLSLITTATLLAGCASAAPVCVPAAPAGPAAMSAAIPPTEPAAAAAPPATPLTTPVAANDAALQAALVGSWIVPRDSADFRNVPVSEVYRADGSLTLYFFDTPACAKVTGQVDAEWHVERGLLIEKVTRVSTGQFAKVGDLSTDQIITMDGTNMTLQNLREGLLSWTGSRQVFARRKSAGCFDAKAG